MIARPLQPITAGALNMASVFMQPLVRLMMPWHVVPKVQPKPADAALEPKVEGATTSIAGASKDSIAKESMAVDRELLVSKGITHESSVRFGLSAEVLAGILRKLTSKNTSHSASVWSPATKTTRRHAAVSRWMRRMHPMPHKEAIRYISSHIRYSSALPTVPHTTMDAAVSGSSTSVHSDPVAASADAAVALAVGTMVGAAMMTFEGYIPSSLIRGDGHWYGMPAARHRRVSMIEGRRLGRPVRCTGVRIIGTRILPLVCGANASHVLTDSDSSAKRMVQQPAATRNGRDNVPRAIDARLRPRSVALPHAAHRPSANYALRMSGARVYRRDTKTSAIASRDLFAIHAASRPSTEVGVIVRERLIGDCRVHIHYARQDGKLVFAGWEDARAARGGLPDALSYAARAALMLRSDPFAVLGLGSPGGESAFKLPIFGGADDSFDEHVMSIVIAQLADGPASCADLSYCDAVNTMMNARCEAHENTIGADAWTALLLDTLVVAARSTPLFDEGGMRSLDAIHADAARILGIGHDRFASWEEHFGIDALSLRLFAVEQREAPFKGDAHARLIRAIERQIGIRAAVLVPHANGHFAISRGDENDAHTLVARTSIVGPGTERIRVMGDLIISTGKRNKALAGRMLALLVAHSTMNGSDGVESFAPRWSAQEMRGVIAAIMKGPAWDVVSHRSCRQYLTPAQNVFMNDAIHDVNYASSIETIGKADVAALSDEEFWALVDSTGQTDTILDDAIRRMMLRDIEHSFESEDNAEYNGNI